MWPGGCLACPLIVRCTSCYTTAAILCSHPERSRRVFCGYWLIGESVQSFKLTPPPPFLLRSRWLSRSAAPLTRAAMPAPLLPPLAADVSQPLWAFRVLGLQQRCADPSAAKRAYHRRVVCTLHAAATERGGAAVCPLPLCLCAPPPPEASFLSSPLSFRPARLLKTVHPDKGGDAAQFAQARVPPRGGRCGGASLFPRRLFCLPKCCPLVFSRPNQAQAALQAVLLSLASRPAADAGGAFVPGAALPAEPAKPWDWRSRRAPITHRCACSDAPCSAGHNSSSRARRRRRRRRRLAATRPPTNRRRLLLLLLLLHHLRRPPPHRALSSPPSMRRWRCQTRPPGWLRCYPHAPPARCAALFTPPPPPPPPRQEDAAQR